MATTVKDYPSGQPAQHQDRQPGLEHQMRPLPVSEDPQLVGSGKLQDMVAVITGGDSGIGRAVASAFAREGAHVAILYLNEHEDAEAAKQQVLDHGRTCECISGDIGDEEFCRHSIEQVIERFGRIDILVNNAAEQWPQESIEEITSEQLERTFRTNVFSFFYLTQAALPHMKEGASIINTTSVTAYRGSAHLLDYSSTKGAIVAFTRSLALALAERKIRVNGVAPGPIWTPLIPSTFPEKDVADFGKDVPMKRAGQPEEVASCYVFLASPEASYISGQILHPNGGEIING
jgi:NAD(P)-dependent dehydrogenase (short-subunit alcohol dehydrogenase family)